MGSRKTQVSKWVPKIGEKFWFIQINTGGASANHTVRGADNGMRMRVGNFYKTREEATFVTKTINALFAKNR